MRRPRPPQSRALPQKAKTADWLGCGSCGGPCSCLPLPTHTTHPQDACRASAALQLERAHSPARVSRCCCCLGPPAQGAPAAASSGAAPVHSLA